MWGIVIGMTTGSLVAAWLANWDDLSVGVSFGVFVGSAWASFVSSRLARK